MKKQKIIYRSVTILFVLFMGLGAIGNLLVSADSVAVMTHLGYPVYITPFIGLAKLLGCVALLVRGFPGIKEWAYAGFMFDLLGATYSNVMTDGLQLNISVMILPFALIIPLVQVLPQAESTGKAAGLLKPLEPGRQKALLLQGFLHVFSSRLNM